MSVIPLRVAVRARPLIQKEIDEGCQQCLTVMKTEPQIILGKDKSFTYDYVFSSDTGQVNVYQNAVEPLIEHIFKGYNATVLAYGQTGSGKTFTMGGGYEASLKMDPEGMGIIPRIILDLFTGSAEKLDYEYAFKVSYLEIINEELKDLLCSKSKDSLTLREENGEIKIPGLKEVDTKTAVDTMRLLEQGGHNRTTASTAMNNTSSRSHAVFTLNIEQKHKEDVDNYWKAKLQLVDLAGSERVKKTHAEGERLKEGININKGLLCLGNVISALGDETQKKLHIPYRDSKLTRLLQDSLGGNSHTLMIACVSPADSNMEETLNTLRYADRARKIKNKPVINWDPQTAKIMQLQEHIQQLTMKLIHAGIADITPSSTNSSSETTPTKQNLRTKLRELTENCDKLKEENVILSKDLQQSVDQAASMFEKAIKQEMKCEKLEHRLEEYEKNIGTSLGKVDFNLLSSSITEAPTEVTEQIEQLKQLAMKVEEKSVLVDIDDSIKEEDDEENMEGDGSVGEVPFTPETRELAKQHNLRRAKMNSDLEQLNKMLAMKEKIANQMSKDNDVQVIKEQYEETQKQYEDEITGLQKEKENLMSALEDAKTNAAAGKISEQRRKRLNELELQLTNLKKKLVDQKKLLNNKERTEKEVSKLNTEIQSMKQQKVKLIKQMKEDAEQWRKWRQQKDKELIQLQQKDRKRQFELQKLQREHTRTQSVLHRKSEEAAAANRRLKEALSKQKLVLNERNQKFEKMDSAGPGDKIRKLLSHELDVKVGVAEAKYHREVLLQDRRTLAEEMKTLRESLDDNGPPSKKMAWMDDSGQKCETSFQEEKKKKRLADLQQQIELMNVQIADLQQKVFDAEQESKGKSTKDNLHTMMEAKIAVKWLLEKAVDFKVQNGRLTSDMQDAKENMQDSRTDHDKYISELEEEIEDLKGNQQVLRLTLTKEHQRQIEIIKSMVEDEHTKQIEKLNATVAELKSSLEEKNKVTKDMEKHIKSCMYKEKNLALMPELTDDEEQSKSPFLSPRPKALMQFKQRRKTGLFQQKNKEEEEVPEEEKSADSATSSVMNTTFECEPSLPTQSLLDNIKSEEEEEDTEKVISKPPIRGRKLRSSNSRRALTAIQDESVRSSDEFEKGPMRKSVSAGSLRRKRSASNIQKSGSLKKKVSSSDISASTDDSADYNSFLNAGLQRKKNLYSLSNSYFGPPE